MLKQIIQYSKKTFNLDNNTSNSILKARRESIMDDMERNYYTFYIIHICKRGINEHT